MTRTLQSRFLAAEEQFLTAFAAGEDAVSKFNVTWIALSKEFTTAKLLEQLDTQTIRLADTVASRMAILAEHLLALDVKADEMCTTFKSSCLDILSQVNTHPSLPPSSPPDFLSEPSLAIATHRSTSLDVAALHWLRLNLHNPYPSASVKASLADSCACSVRDVQTWFAEARRRVGWTTLCGEMFGGCRKATSEAASLAYRGDAASDRLPLDLRRAFSAIEANARDLCLWSATGEDAIDLQDVQGGIGDEPVLGGCWGTPITSRPLVIGEPGVAIDPPPSGFLSEEAEEDTTPPPAIAGCKRSFDTSVEAVGDSIESCLVSWASSRPIKRHRSSTPSTRPHCPPATPEDTETMLIASGVNIPVLSAPTSVSRKRRLSDTDLSTSPKRPRGLFAGPRKQVVSDPLPVDDDLIGLGDSVVDGWSILDTPAGIDYLDPSLSFDAQMARSNDTSYAGDFSLRPTIPASQMDISDTNLMQATLEGFDLSLFDPLDPTTTSAPHPPCLSQEAFSDCSSSPSSTYSYSEMSDPGTVDASCLAGPTENWNEFVDILKSFDFSPTSSQSSLSDCRPESQAISECPSSLLSDDITHTLFGIDSSFSSSDFLSDIGEFSSLRMPLEATI